MKTLPFHAWMTTALALLAFNSAAGGAETPAVSAPELASRLSALQQGGTDYVRLRMENEGQTRQTLQLQIKERRTKGSSEVVYQILFPKERKGESVLIRQSSGHAGSGSHFLPPNTVKPISDLKEALFESALSYEDLVENFYAWDQQTIVGNEAVENVKCVILESKPGKGGHSFYGSVKSWIDPQRLVPMRVEKFSSSGQLVRRIETTRVVADAGKHIPADLVVHSMANGATTRLDGSRIRHDVNYSEADFTAEGLKRLESGPAAGE